MQLRILFVTSCFIACCSTGFAQIKILHYTATSGFDHQTRNVSYDMLQQLSSQYNFIADNDSTGYSFNNVTNLNQYDVIVFANTTGDAILDSSQRIHFEQYMANGGNVIGLHSATDTYRHSTANGTNTGSWDFYSELIGASVQQNPSHVNGTPLYTMHALQAHQLLNDIPDPWLKPEEYYYWQYGYFDTTGNIVLLLVDSTTGPNGMVNSYDLPRATTWYKITPSGNRIFYTSLGHAVSNYISDTLFINLVRNAILWTAGITITIKDDRPGDVKIMSNPNPFSETLTITLNNYHPKEKWNLSIFNVLGQQMFLLADINAASIEINGNSLPKGIYFIKAYLKNNYIVNKIMK